MATIVTRSGKGSPLTNTEVDANFTNLNTDKVELTNLSVSSASASGGGSLSYANGSGVFTYTPPDLSGKQAASAKLTDISALAVTNGNIIVGDGSNFVAESGATARTSLGLAIGTNVQAYDAQLTDVAGLAVTDGGFIVGNGSNFVLESGGTARTSLGLAIGTNVLAYDSNLQSFVTAFTLPTSDGSSGQALTTNASGTLAFSDVDSLPSQSGNSGKFLTTNGSAASWGAVGNHADGGFSNSTYLALQSIDGGSASG